MSVYRCPGCGYTYDEQTGHPREGFPAGTPWSEVPEDWACPDCGVREQVDFTLAGTGELLDAESVAGPLEED